jgi:predicted enzyme related to lactoylglutathione lyase
VSERERFIPGVPCWADTTQPDPKRAADFYAGLFGWEVENVLPPDSPGEYWIGRIDGKDAAAVGSAMGDAPPTAVWNTYVWVESADETAGKAAEAGGAVLVEPFDVMESGRMSVISDPEGAAICLWEPHQHRGAGVVNEHGSVNFNALNTRDPEAAKDFYRRVLSWETMTVGGGFELWTLPGYGDHLEALNPGTRARVAEVGGPAGFEDVVASIAPIAGDDPDTPAHWGVTFACHDADAIAARAKELGAEVVAPPMDAPWVRTTVIRDPQGAIFTANQFVLENKDLASAATAA